MAPKLFYMKPSKTSEKIIIHCKLKETEEGFTENHDLMIMDDHGVKKLNCRTWIMF